MHETKAGLPYPRVKEILDQGIAHLKIDLLPWKMVYRHHRSKRILELIISVCKSLNWQMSLTFYCFCRGVVLRGDLPKVFLVLHLLSLSKIVDAVKIFQSVCQCFSFRIFGWMFKMRGVGTAQHWLRRFTSWAHDMQSIWRQLLRVPTFALIPSFFLSYNQGWWWWKRGCVQYKYTWPWIERWGIIFTPFVIISSLH